MRRFLIAAALIATLIAVDALANDLRFSRGLYSSAAEFVRLVTRFLR